MKTELLLITMLLIASVSSAQIIITAENGAIDAEKYPYTYVKNKGTALPDTGQNMVWDYSYFVPCDDCESEISFKKNKDEVGSNIGLYAQSALNVLGVPIPAITYITKNEEGDIFVAGAVYKSRVLPLIRFTGHPMDRLKMEGNQEIVPILELDFPFEYGKKWETIIKDTLSFVLNAPSINMKNIDIYQITKTTTSQEIIGYGQLKLPYFEDSEMQLFTYDALLMKRSSTTNMNFESNTSEANLSKILNLAGIEIESESDCNIYKFYVKELPLFVLSMRDCGEKGNIEWVRMRTNLGEFPPKAE
jgi:hypothetical protein